MGQHKNSSFLRRLFKRNEGEPPETPICRPGPEAQGPFYRYRREGGILVPIDNTPYDTWEACKGIAPGQEED